MSGLLDELDDHQDREITLSTGVLLAIFFGVVLICAVFFGLGYSMGRHSTETTNVAKTQAAKAKSAAPDANESDESDSATVEKPSAVSSSGPKLPPRSVPKPPVESSPVQPPMSNAAAKPPSAPAPGNAQIMVQLMAAAQYEDAQVLATALRKRGYSAVVRTEQDRLFHVQIGPFSSRAEADAMKRKLQGDGYNAILK